MNPKTTWQALDLAITLLEQFESQLSASDKDMLNHLREYRDFDRPALVVIKCFFCEKGGTGIDSIAELYTCDDCRARMEASYEDNL